MISVILAVAGLAALFGTFPVAQSSRWGWLSPWITVCVLAAAALMFASGAQDGHWLVCAAGVLVAGMQAAAGGMSARARRRIRESRARKPGEAS